MSFPNFGFDNDKVNDFFSNVGSVLIEAAKDKFIKVAEPPKGNLSPAQVADGQRGQIQGLPAPEVNNASKFTGIALIIGSVLAAIFLFKKK